MELCSSDFWAILARLCCSCRRRRRRRNRLKCVLRGFYYLPLLKQHCSVFSCSVALNREVVQALITLIGCLSHLSCLPEYLLLKLLLSLLCLDRCSLRRDEEKLRRGLLGHSILPLVFVHCLSWEHQAVAASSPLLLFASCVLSHFAWLVCTASVQFPPGGWPASVSRSEVLRL